MAAKPFMKFYPQDWRADEKLRLCSLAARGLWIEMLALMHRSERYGQLLISGQAPTDAQLAIQVGAPPDQVSELIGQLEAAGVFSRAASGAIYSRRMTRDERKAKVARQNGKSGGNPSLRKQTAKTGLDKGVVMPRDKASLKPQRPEARSSEANASGVPPDDPVKALFDLGVSIFMAAGRTEREARSVVGKLRNDIGDAEASARLLTARDKTDPVAWLMGGVAKGRSDTDALIAEVGRRYGNA